MNRVKPAKFPTTATIVAVLACGLLLMLWLSLGTGPGYFPSFSSPQFSIHYLHTIRSTFPLIAASIAIVLILIRINWHQAREILSFNPLAFLFLYGVVGIVASAFSPDANIALYWALAYLSVPVVLGVVFVASREGDGARQVLNFSWILIFVFVVVLYVIALHKLTLASIFTDPAELLKCNREVGGDWYRLTSGLIRSTAVGRYAAIAAIIALGALARPKYRPLWVFIFIACTVLMIYSGARTSLVGFAIAAPLVIMLVHGKRLIKPTLLSIAILIPIFWTTGIHHTFLDYCIFRSSMSDESLPKIIDPLTTPAAALSTPPSSPTYVVTVTPQVVSESESVVKTKVPQRALTDPEKIPVPMSSSSSETTSRQTIAASETAPPNSEQSEPPSRSETTSQQTMITSETTSETAQQSSSETTSRLTMITSETISETAEQTALPLSSEVTSQQTTITSETAGKKTETTSFQSRISAWANKRFGHRFITLTGRTPVWIDSFQLLRQSPFLGYGFQADRLLLKTHAHNLFVQALLQTGIVGTIPLILGLFLGWYLLLNALRYLNELATPDKVLLIQATGVLVFLAIRSITESTGAFFGVDWLILAPIFLYLQFIYKTKKEAHH